MNIYEIKGQFLQLQQLIEDGEIDQEFIADTLESIQGDIEEKAEGYGQIITNLTALSNGLKEESKKFSNRASSIDSEITKMKDRLKTNMLEMELKKIDTTHFKFSTRKSESLKEIDRAFIPSEYIKSVTTESVDKTALKKAIKNGLTCEGAKIVENYSLQIK